jgi:tripartite ATP-independent transporter DctP family solute receptor
MMKKVLGIVCCLLLLSSMAFAGGSGDKPAPAAAASGGGAPLNLNVGMTLELDSHYGKGLAELKRLLAEYSNGQIVLTIHPSSTQGGERDMIESVAMGTLEMSLISTGPVPNFFPDFAVLDLPYLFPTAAQAYKILDGEVGTSLLNQMASKGIIGLGFWENGFRHVTNSAREIKTPADLKGLKIRTMENPIHMETYKYYGASPTPMAMGEVFMALQQKTVDGQENPAINILTSKLNEVQKFMSLTGNFYSPSLLMFSKSVYDKMTKQQQDILVKAATEAKNWERNYSQTNTADAVAKIKASGTLVTEVNLQEWIDFSKAVYTNPAVVPKLNQALLQKIQAVK